MLRWRSPLGAGVLCWLLLVTILGLSRAADDAQMGHTPEDSTVETFKTKGYAVFRNVLLRETGLLFFLPERLADAPPDVTHQVPNVTEMLRWQFWSDSTNMQVEVVNPHNRSAYLDTCKGWIEEPTIVYAGMAVDHLNVYHFFMDNFIRMFGAVTDLNLFDVDAFLNRTEMPAPRNTDLIVLQKHAENWQSKFHDLFDHITPHQWSYPHGVGFCFKTLIVGADGIAQTYSTAKNTKQQEERSALLALFRRFAIPAQLRTDALRGRAVAADLLHQDMKGRIQVGFISRPRSKGMSRAVVNEQELMQALQEKYHDVADVKLLHFNTSLAEAMLVVNRTDILIGIHGAGLTNTLWMRPGGVVIQMFPYGYEQEPGKLYRSYLYEQLAHNMNCTMLFWQNQRAEHAYLLGREPGQEHPAEGEIAERKQWDASGELHRQWFYQDTYVDISSFLPVVNEALQLIQHTVTPK